MSATLSPLAVMKRLSILWLVLFSALGVSKSSGATPVPLIFVNNNPVQPPELPPQIDATIFWNRALFVVSNDFLFPGLSVLPYSGKSVRFWTNNSVMLGLPGFDFQYVPNRVHLTQAQRLRRGANLPQPSRLFFNDGQITVSDYLSIRAVNIVNPGALIGDLRARVNLTTTNGLADLSRGAFRVGELPLPECSTGGGFFFDPQLRNIYASIGTNGSVNSNQFWAPFTLSSLGNSFTPIGSAPPPFQRIQINAIYPGAPATNRSTNLIFGLTNCGDYGSFVHVVTNLTTVGLIQVTNLNVNMVFVPTNGFTEGTTVDVGFPFGGLAAPVVQFRTPDFDVIGQKSLTNFLNFTDSGNGARIYRGRDCFFDTYQKSNTPYAPGLFHDFRFETNRLYTYSASLNQIGNTNSFYHTNLLSALVFTELGKSPAASDPTNYNGLVQIKALRLNLAQARIRGENAVDIYTSNLVDMTDSAIDSPFINFDVSTTNNTLVVSNLFRPIVNRLQATLESWTAVWTSSVTNGLSTNVVNGTNVVTPILATWNYRVLVLGACIATEQPAIMHKFTLHADNMIIRDKLAVNNALRLDGKTLHFGPGSGLSLPFNTSLAFTNLIGITRLTNEGVLNIPRAAFFGSFVDGYVQPPRRRTGRAPRPRLVTYESLVNRNTISAASFSTRANYVEIAGPQFFPALLEANNGLIEINGATVVVSNAVVRSQSDILITAGNLLATSSTLVAGTNGTVGNYIPGALVIDATNSITDGGPNAGNRWLVTSGARILRRPANGGDLMGTRLVSRASTFAKSVISWAGLNLGSSPSGFTNNLALGRLTLDGAVGTSFRFKSAGTGNAIYIDYLEMINFPTNFSLASVLSVDPDFTLYFADSNIPAGNLTNNSGGRIRWVSDFAGPQSSTNITYPNGLTYTFNSALVRSRDLDSDGDTIFNGNDCTPLAVPGFDSTQPCPPAPDVAGVSATASADLGLSISLDGSGQQVVLDWTAPAASANTVEFSDSVTTDAWQTLTNFINGPVTARVTVKDAVGAPLRVYRVRVDAGKP